MKRLLLLLFIAALTWNFNKSFSWDSTAAKFYPLAVGNLWSYRHVNFAQFSCVPMSYYDYVVKIDSLVSRPNGKWYFKFSDGSLRRVDSITMNVYAYYTSGECLMDSLFARKNDTIGNCTSPRPIVTDTTHVMFANTDRRKLRMQQMLIGVFYYELVEGLGLFHRISCEGGGYQIGLNGCIINGIQYGQILGFNQINSEVPDKFSLSQNYPNPFNPSTKIRFDIASVGTVHRTVRLIVYDALGREIQTLVNEQLTPGTYEVDFDGSNLPSGVYYYKLETELFTETKKMVLIK
ncbi:MAG: T9SS type A sorting domain-containing protein [Chlorobi bacterium]|nr:T9SS type A sorting domain-containing protein [Chlorobiota bacterium]MCI0716052.1 T9SS type A sorting domain-containing protein [Chlorobiota bacterium]